MAIKNISPALFGVIIICFFLPWVIISCGGEKMATFTGIQLVTGTTVEEPQMFDFAPTEKKETSGEPFAIFILLLAVAGLGLSFIKGKIGAIVTIAASVIGLIFILLLKSKLDSDILREGGGILQIEYGAGFYIAIILFFSAIVINGYSMKESRGFSLPNVKMSKAKYCTKCGSKNKLDNTFCIECGNEFS